MEKRILIAVDDSIHSKKAVEYAVMIRSVVNELSYTLFNVQPKISEFLLEDAKSDAKARASLKEIIRKNHESSEKLLDDYKALMIKSGIEEKNIETVSRPKIQGTAKDILDYAKESLHDAILLGRRGVSRLEESFVGSVSNNIIEHTNDTPVWAIGGEVVNTHILMAIDGSESALRAVDHVSFMIEQNPDVLLTLLHVTPRLRDYCTIEFESGGEEVEDFIVQGSKKCVDDFYVHAKKRLEESGIQESNIEIREVASTINIGKTIVNEAEKMGCGIVVMGRRGTSKSFFMGRVSRYILAHATNCAVWLVP